MPTPLLRSGPRAALAALATLTAAAAAPAAAQEQPRLRVVAVVDELSGAPTADPLRVGRREPAGNLTVDGAVRVRSNSPFRLEARLARAHRDQVIARTELSPGRALSATAWLPIASGTAGTATLPVSFLVAWARNSPKRPQDAVEIPVVYRIVREGGR